MRLLAVDGHADRLDDGWQADAAVVVPGRWVRVGAFYGPPPGSHMGLWRTRCDDLRGLNWRVQLRNRPWRCLTLIAHTRPERRR